jgi:hypothetical protein
MHPSYWETRRGMFKCGMELITSCSNGCFERKKQKSVANPFSATVDNVNDYLKVKMHLVKTICKQPYEGFIGNFNAANTTSIDAKLKRKILILQMPKNKHAEHIVDNSEK